MVDQTTKGELADWINKTNYNETEKIQAVTQIYDRLNLKEKSEKLINEYYKKAVSCLDNVNVDMERKWELYKLAENLTSRIF